LGAIQPQIEALALRGYHGVGASGVARSDFMINRDGQIYFLEINTIPGMTGHSLVPQSVAAVGIDFDKLCLMILDGAGLGK
jgi:D-alanine-D-alanine ligase